MRKLVENFGVQLEDAIKIAKGANFTKMDKPLSNVLISGMGGSGIGGSIVSEIAMMESSVPVNVSKNYAIPSYVNGNTLVVISSFSGNTEETLQAMQYAIEKKAKVVCIASGGKVIDIAKEKNLDHVVVPTGMAPRAAFGYSFVQLLFIMNFFGIISNKFSDDLSSALKLLVNEKENINTEAKKVADVLFKKIPIIYAPSGYEGTAIRLRQQLNENSKMVAFTGVVPEMNHNELVGWAGGNAGFAVLFFRNTNDNPRIAKRIDISKEVILKHTPNIVEVYSKGDSIIEQSLYLIHLGDLVSVYLYEMSNVDPDDIKVIDYLKSSLAKM